MAFNDYIIREITLMIPESAYKMRRISIINRYILATQMRDITRRHEVMDRQLAEK